MTDILGRRIIQKIFSGQIKKLSDAVSESEFLFRLTWR